MRDRALPCGGSSVRARSGHVLINQVLAFLACQKSCRFSRSLVIALYRCGHVRSAASVLYGQVTMPYHISRQWSHIKRSEPRRMMVPL